MNYIAIALFALIGVATAQQQQNSTDGRALAESLEKRAAAVQASAKKALDDLEKTNEYYLADFLERQTTRVEALALSLKNKLAQKDVAIESREIHLIEEELLKLENSIVDELAALQDVQKNFKPTPSNENKADELVKKGQELVKKAKAEVEKEGQWADGYIEYEIQQVEKLIKAIQAKPKGAELENDEKQLARHERTLKDLLDRASQRNGWGPRGQ